MRYVTFLGNFDEVKDQLNKDGIKVEDSGKIKRFQSFSCSMNYNSVNESVHKVFPLESDIPVITEDEFITSFMTENYFINHQVHVVALQNK